MPRTENEIREELAQAQLGATIWEKSEPVMAARFRARVLELRAELRSLDDTPIVPYRPASVPPTTPRGRRPPPPPIPPAARGRK